MSRDAIVFYASFYEAVKGLDAKDFQECITAVLEYGLNDREIEMSGIAKMFFTMAKPQIDANNKRFANGKRGGRPPKTETKPIGNLQITNTKPNRNQTKTKSEPKDKEKENVKDKENVKENIETPSSPLEDIPEITESYLYPQQANIYAPQLIDVQEFFALKGFITSPEAFFYHYDSTNWRVGGEIIKDWKKLARSWEAGEKQKQKNRNTKSKQEAWSFNDV